MCQRNRDPPKLSAIAHHILHLTMRHSLSSSSDAKAEPWSVGNMAHLMSFNQTALGALRTSTFARHIHPLLETSPSPRSHLLLGYHPFPSPVNLQRQRLPGLSTIMINADASSLAPTVRYRLIGLHMQLCTDIPSRSWFSRVLPRASTQHCHKTPFYNFTHRRIFPETRTLWIDADVCSLDPTRHCSILLCSPCLQACYLLPNKNLQ